MRNKLILTLLTAVIAMLLAACDTTSTGVTPAEPGGEVTEPAEAEATQTVEPVEEATAEGEATEEVAEEITGTVEMTATPSITATTEMTPEASEEMTGTEEITGTQDMTDTEEMTGTEEITGTQEMTGTGSAEDMGTVNLSSNTEMDSHLVDQEGMTLYTFEGDDPDSIDTTMWLPVEAGDNDFVGAGLDENLLGTTDREDGTTQVTYNDRPLYRFIGDLIPGDILGQGVDRAWWMVSGEGEILTGDE